ncbi:Hypothetical protein KK9_2018 (plasmid) [Borreliella garinii BgVir]|nr:Hypothetical protein KK9_2018 [Borreliella garinii BgVir]
MFNTSFIAIKVLYKNFLAFKAPFKNVGEFVFYISSNLL